MTLKVIVAAVTLLLNLAMGFVFFAFMIVAMNGFRGDDASWGIYLYFGLWLLISTSMSVAATLFTRWLEKRAMRTVAIGFLSPAVFTIVGTVLLFLGCIAGIAVADIVRRS